MFHARATNIFTKKLYRQVLSQSIQEKRQNQLQVYQLFSKCPELRDLRGIFPTTGYCKMRLSSCASSGNQYNTIS